MKPKIYRLQHEDWESSFNFDFIHPGYDKSDEQFKHDIQSLMKKYGDEYLNDSQSWIGTDGFITFIAPKLKELGYEEIHPTTFYTFQGGGIIRKGFVENEHLPEKEREIINVMGEDFINKCIKKNIEFEKELYKDNEELLKTINNDFKI